MNFRGKCAAQYLGVSEAWLRKARQDKAGPPYVRIGRSIIYRKDDLDAFLEKHLNLPEDGVNEGIVSPNTNSSGARHDQ